MKKEIKEKTENWEKEFDEKFGYKDDPNKLNQWGSTNIKFFISAQIQKAKEEALKEVAEFVEAESGKSGRKEILSFINILKQKR